MNMAFSAKRHASMNSGMSCFLAMAATSWILERETGWPAAVLLVTVSRMMGTLLAPTERKRGRGKRTDKERHRQIYGLVRQKTYLLLVKRCWKQCTVQCG